MSNEANPFVTVIVPVRNAPQRIRRCIEALLAQSYPRECYEIIVVDNGSHDITPQVIQSYPVTILIANNRPTPYLARNAGIQHARGEIIALIDANCTPIAQWLENGVRTLQQTPADLIGGKVTFTFSPQLTVAEMVDAVLNVNMQYSIEHLHACMTTNLFAYCRVFDAVGLFPDQMRSGGDMIWTRRATRTGFKLVYAPDAEVFYPARKLLPLLKKYYRTGSGAPGIWLDQAQSVDYQAIALRTVRGLLPIFPGSLRMRIIERGTVDMLDHFAAIWWISWLCKVVSTLGSLRALLKRVTCICLRSWDADLIPRLRSHREREATRQQRR